MLTEQIHKIKKNCLPDASITKKKHKQWVNDAV